MVIDTSVIVAIFQKEPGYERLLAAIASADRPHISTASLLESAIVLGSRYGPGAEADLDAFLEEANIDFCPVTTEQAQIARRAYREFGKGRHPAGLNFGDCFSYALAVALGQPLLFKGEDFSKTDVRSIPTLQLGN